MALNKGFPSHAKWKIASRPREPWIGYKELGQIYQINPHKLCCHHFRDAFFLKTGRAGKEANISAKQIEFQRPTFRKV